MPKFLFLDTETTSVDTSRCGLFQIGGIIEIDNEVKEEFNFKCGLFQNDYVDEKSFEKTGVSLKEISSYPNPKETFTNLINTLSKYVDRYDKEDKFLAIGYFSEFDNQVLRSWFKKNGDNFFGSWFFHPFIDVAQLVAYTYMQDRDLFPNFQLRTVAYLLKVIEKDHVEKFHDAMFDVKTTREIYKKVNRVLSP